MTQTALRRSLRLLPHARALIADGRLHVVTQLRTASLGPASPDKRALLRHLSAGLPDRETHDDLVQRLLHQGWLSITVEQRGRPLYTLRPHRPPPAARTRANDETRARNRTRADDPSPREPDAQADVLTDSHAGAEAELPQFARTPIHPDALRTGHAQPAPGAATSPLRDPQRRLVMERSSRPPLP
ncbi:hypothetical protein [Nonomuraea angiospora]|uniref:hypothetical protein n=1 Tax=Nonomuraea angiospora TaxID=46172 RepID=UPI0029BB9712|nr:hypothetical protein [Nonomuraea angiospora]MDX3110741.1 hypothetical protein [Nonomuraea angiospora]